MIHYSQQDLSQLDQYKLLSGSVSPRPIAWITTLNTAANVVNLAPFSFFSVASNQAPLLSVAILRKQGQPKDTAANLLENGQAVVHVVSSEFAEKMNQTAATLAPNASEATLIEAPLTASQSIAVPGLADVKIRFETSVFEYVPLKNTNQAIMTDLFILKVSDFYFDQSVFNPDNKHIRTEVLHPVGRLAGPNYVQVDQTFKMIRPR
ncbi:MAG: flavin reductase family protein [Lactobacillus sp.]|nr:flavin reductase family protein [Lactobacillus sp.]